MAELNESYWEILEPFFPKIDIYNGPDNYAATIAEVPRPIVLLYATHMCLAEIHNGGWLQFFWNNTGIVAPESIEGFQAMGMRAVASVVIETTLKLGDVYPRDRDKRWDALIGASRHSEKELKRIFHNVGTLYRAFAKATEPLGFDSLSQRVWELANTENGGFQEAATRYARRVGVH